MSGREAPARGGKRKRAISPTRSDGAESEAVGTARSTTTAPPAVTVQRSDKGATSVLMAMWDMPETHDVRLLLTSEDVTLSAHRAVLAAASRPFRGQFGGLGQFKEAAGGGAAVMAPVSVPDVDAASMRGMLSFIYGHKVELTLENALSLCAPPPAPRLPPRPAARASLLVQPRPASLTPPPPPPPPPPRPRLRLLRGARARRPLLRLPRQAHDRRQLLLAPRRGRGGELLTPPVEPAALRTSPFSFSRPSPPSPRPPQASCDKLSAHCYEELKRQFEQAGTRPPLHLAFTSP